MSSVWRWTELIVEFSDSFLPTDMRDISKVSWGVVTRFGVTGRDNNGDGFRRTLEWHMERHADKARCKVRDSVTI